MDRKNRKEIFLLVSEGGFLEDIEKAWKDVKESTVVKAIGKKIKEIFFGDKANTIGSGGSKTDTVGKGEDKTKKSTKTNSQDRKDTFRRLTDSSGEKEPSSHGPVSYQPPIKENWKSSGNWYTGAGPNHPDGHQGIDMRASRGTRVYPAAEGKVSGIGTNTSKGGNTVSIDHNDGKTTYYAHLDTVEAHLGQQVDRDTVIGTVGNTGNARGTHPHLHFGIRETSSRGSWQDPAQFFSVPAYSPLSKEEQEQEKGLTFE